MKNEVNRYHDGMCANYHPVTRADRVLTFFGVERQRDEASTDVWPLGLAPFIRLAEDGSGNKRIDDGVFGLLPQFAAEIAQGRKTYNARSETVATLASFRQSWSRGWRCIIPVESFFEPSWETGQAVRWRVQQPGAVPLGIAGIYRPWKQVDGRELLTFAMLTVNADSHPVMRRFHRPTDEKRMVVILEPADYGTWLSCAVADAAGFCRPWPGVLEAMAAPLPAREPRPVKARPVKTDKPLPAAKKPLPPSDGQGQLF